MYDFVAVSAVESVLASGKLSTASPPFVAPSCILTATWGTSGVPHGVDVVGLRGLGDVSERGPCQGYHAAGE